MCLNRRHFCVFMLLCSLPPGRKMDTYIIWCPFTMERFVHGRRRTWSWANPRKNASGCWSHTFGDFWAICAVLSAKCMLPVSCTWISRWVSLEFVLILSAIYSWWKMIDDKRKFFSAIFGRRANVFGCFAMTLFFRADCAVYSQRLVLLIWLSFWFCYLLLPVRSRCFATDGMTVLVLCSTGLDSVCRLAGVRRR